MKKEQSKNKKNQALEDKCMIYVKCCNEYLTPPENENNPLGVLGERITEIEKISELPDNVTMGGDDKVLCEVYTDEGVKLAYDESSYDGVEIRKDLMPKMNKEWVHVNRIGYKEGDDTLYLECTEDQYSKLVYLLKKNGVLYKLSE